ncbi:MAG TPA: hypothetical protein VHE54_15295 [Puia sp.]|nr:hypothetical protein [Puia sp.]
MGYLLISLKRAFRNLYVLTFLNGFLLACLFFFHVLSVYESGLFNSIKSNIDATITARDNRDSVLLRSMYVCYRLMHFRQSIFAGNAGRLGPQAGIFRSTSVDLNTAEGSCGSYCEVLVRILETYHYPARIAQMKVNGTYGGHITVEAWSGDAWVALDPSYNLHYVRPDGRLASIADIRGNWDFYKKQVPSVYNPSYRYEDVRYTNWSKIPLVMPALRWVISLFLGAERTNGLSLRVFFLYVYDIYFYIVLALELALLAGTIRLRIRIRRNPAGILLSPNPSW